MLLYTGTGYDTYFNFFTNVWVKQGAGFGSQNGLVIPPGTAMLVVHAASLNMTVANGFEKSSTVGSSTQILNWLADTTINAAGWTTHYLSFDDFWRTQGTLADVTNAPLFRHCRAAHVDVQADQLNWRHFRPWNPAPWVQPAP